jgi:cysteine desulfurase
MDRIYLDYAATTPVDLRVIQSMIPYFETNFGNPSSIHFVGQSAEHALATARKNLLMLMGASTADLIFTSGGTESDNLAIRGLVARKEEGKRKILISPVEHPAVSNTCETLQGNIEIIKLRVDKYGLIDIESLRNQINNETLLVSVIWGNNEIGTINDIKQIGHICRDQKVLFHTDAVQAAAHLKINFDESNIDLLSYGAHKFYGPKGVGGLLISHEVQLIPQITGGSQENNTRAGTSNIPLIKGMEKAYEIFQDEVEKDNSHKRHLRDILIEGVTNNIPGSYLTGHPEKRLPNHASFVIEEVRGQDLVIGMDMAGFSISSGSACKVGNPTPSQVLLAIGIPKDLAIGAIRVTVGKNTTESEVKSFLSELPKLVKTLRKK